MAWVEDIRPDEAEVDRVLPDLCRALADLLTPDKLTALEIAVAEALTNAIRHARASGTPETIRIAASVEPARVRIEIVDAGDQSPADLFEDVADLDQIDPLAEGGRGLSLISHCADGVEFVPAQGRNLLRLAFDRQEGA
ncbi:MULTISPECIES: ATP-binding protein [Paracoccus]|uniref:ATP-binding protein n=1 Tax=Paracoccus TaxID=265 RepID=UPI0003B7712D|nr:MULTISPECIES: ATP-binding protein [Paracoccus]